MIFHVWRTNPTLLQKMAQEIVRRALVTGPPPQNLAGLKLVLRTALILYQCLRYATRGTFHPSPSFGLDLILV